MQEANQTEKEKLEMYMKCSKEQLAIMLIQSNKVLDNLVRISMQPINNPLYPATYTIGSNEIKTCDCKLKNISTGPFMCHGYCQH